jgi:hypothetical protein
MATAKKTSLKPSTRARGQLRADQQEALRKVKADPSLLKPKARPKPKAKAKAKAKVKNTPGVVGLAQKLRRRFPK